MAPTLRSTTLKYVAVLLVGAIVLGANLVRAEAEADSPNSIQTPFRPRQARTFDGGITSGFTTALSSIGTIGVLGLILLGILLLPTVLSIVFAGPAGVVLKRAFDDGFQIDKPVLMARLAMLQDAWQKFDVKDPQCRKRLICDVHAIEDDMGPTARSLIKAMDYVSNIGLYNLPEPINSIVREYMDATRTGKNLKNCSKYSSCPYSLASQYRANQS